MAADSDGSLTAVVICEGNLHDPEFPRKFRHLLSKLKYILQQPKKSKKLKVNKVEPWNSVRVTLSIPKDAAARLRQLASEGSSALRALGILSVQLEGDSVISLRLLGQELVLRTDNTTAGCVQEAGSSNTTLNDLTQILGNRMQQTTAGPSSSSSMQSIPPTPPPSISEPIAGPSNRNIIPVIPQIPLVLGNETGSGGVISNNVGPMQTVVMNGPSPNNFDKPPVFKSPNTVCPMDGKLPVPPLANIAETREYPFESMTQARVIQRRENTMAVVAALGGGSQTPVPSTNATLVLNQGQQVTPPPLTMPVAGVTVADSVSQQAPQSVIKSPFIQPPPPPYPTANNHLKSASHSAQHTLQPQQTNSISMASNSNALSSPLLVNLLQNDGVSQVKVVPAPSPALLQHQQSSSSGTMVPNLPNHTQNDGVLLLNNSNNSSDSSSGISISPSIPVPSSSQTISNIGSNSVVAPAPAVPNTGLNQNILGPPPQSVTIPGVGIRVQQQRFSVPQTGQQIVLPQHQIIHTGAGGVPIQRFPSQAGPIIAGVGPIAGVSTQTFRHPHQQGPQQVQIAMQQPYAAPAPPHPSLVNQMQQQQPQTQQGLVNNFNHPRWPFKPMDSATKSSFQEFTRYQLQYNLQQEMNNQTVSTAITGAATTGLVDGPTATGNASASTAEKSGIADTLGLGSYLDELTKTDLDSLLLPGLNDLDSTLELDGKNLESLLDEKDLDLDLIGPEGAGSTLPGVASVSGSSLDLGIQGQVAITSSGPALITSQTNPQANPLGASTSKSTKPNSSTLSGSGQKNTKNTGKERQYLINPLTGELEPVPSDEESEPDPSPVDNMDAFNEFNSEISNSLYSDDDNSCSTAFSKASDHSDTERSSNSEASGRSRYSKSKKDRREPSSIATYSNKKSKPSIKNNLLREKLQQGIKEKMSGKSKQPKEKVTTKAKVIPSDGKDSPSEKIKLRLKLEKSKPVSPAYKVDISFVPSPKRAQALSNSASSLLPNYSSSSQSSMTSNSSPNIGQQHQHVSQTSSASNNASNQSPHAEEPRVPPLHISLRGKNSIVIKNSKKDRKKSQSGGEEDDSYLKKAQMKRNNSAFEEQTVVNRFIVSNDHSHYQNSLNNKASSQGKPITRPSSHDEYPVCNNYQKSALENGDDSDKCLSSSKRIASDLVVNPNGMICPEIKRRRMSQTVDQQQQQNALLSGDKGNVEPYNHLQGPIGSTNVGTLPTHSSLSKNQKGSNNNNSAIFVNKLHKSSAKSGKPLVIVKQCKSPTTNPVKDPGKSPPTVAGLETAVVTESPTIPATMSSSPTIPSSATLQVSSNVGNIECGTSTKGLPSTAGANSTNSQANMVNKQTPSICLLPQGNVDAISKEKFKQKLLEFQGTDGKEVAEKTLVRGSNVATANINNTTNLMAASGKEKRDKSAEESMAKALPATLSDGEKQLPIESARTSPSNASVSPSSSSSATNLIEVLEDKIELKEPSAIQEEQLRPPHHTQNTAPIDMGINLLNNGNGSSNVRNSPGSQAQGEDSGIESMDALSEKSPHQSASPQQGDSHPPQLQPKREVVAEHPKIDEKLPLHTRDEQEDEITNISDIEAALAKMEGINDHFLTPCESPMHKLNGDHTMKEESLLENLTDEKLMFCASKMEQDDLAAIMGGSSGKSSPVLSPLAITKIECRDLNENKEISPKISLETQLIDECCKKSLKPNTKLEDDTGESTRISSPPNSSEQKCEENVIKIESSPNEVDVKPVAESVKPESVVVKEEHSSSDSSAAIAASVSSTVSCDVISDSKEKSAVDIKEILTPISIEIPTHPESEVPRVRTRASSKLESPLDAPKQSPQLDSPAPTNSLKSNLRLSAAAIDRLSPKVSSGKGGCGGSMITSGKRKRQGSESSTQSCVSDDTPGRSNSSNGSSAKRTRPNSCSSTPHGSTENLNAAAAKSTSGSASVKKPGTAKLKRTPEESSDSDEPLIEVVGKVRSSKGKPSSSAESSDSKILRNHRTSSQHSRSSSHSTSSSASATSNANHNSSSQHGSMSKTIRGGSSSSSHSSSSSSSSTTTASNSSTSQNNTHCTRASSGAGTGSATSAAGSSTSVAAVHNNHSTPTGPAPNSTRRSVRASAAANKIIYARSGGANHSNNSNSNDSNKAGSGNAKGSSASASVAEGSEPRRKTRSAAGGEPTEGRRRRASRDISSNEEDDDEEEKESEEDEDEDFESQTTEIDVNDLFQSPSQRDSDEVDEEQAEFVAGSYPLSSSRQQYIDHEEGGYRLNRLHYSGSGAKLVKMPRIGTEAEGDDELEPVSISDYDISDDEPSPVMTSTDEDDSSDTTENKEMVIPSVHVPKSSANFSENDRELKGNKSNSDRSKFAIPIVAIPIGMKR